MTFGRLSKSISESKLHCGPWDVTDWEATTGQFIASEKKNLFCSLKLIGPITIHRRLLIVRTPTGTSSGSRKQSTGFKSHFPSSPFGSWLKVKKWGRQLSRSEGFLVFLRLSDIYLAHQLIHGLQWGPGERWKVAAGKQSSLPMSEKGFSSLETFFSRLPHVRVFQRTKRLAVSNGQMYAFRRWSIRFKVKQLFSWNGPLSL